MNQENIKLFLKHTAHLHEENEKKITAMTQEQFAETAMLDKIFRDVQAEANALATDKQIERLDTVMKRFTQMGTSISQAFGEALISGQDFKDGMVLGDNIFLDNIKSRSIFYDYIRKIKHKYYSKEKGLKHI